MTSKAKNGLLWIGLLVALFISYKFAIARTVEVRDEYRRLDSSLYSGAEHASQINLLTKKEATLDSVLYDLNFETSSLENRLLQHLKTTAERSNVTLINFESPHIYQSNSGETRTYIMVLRGHFLGILKTIHAMEQKHRLGKVASINFEKKKMRGSKKMFLEAEVLLQSFK